MQKKIGDAIRVQATKAVLCSGNDDPKKEDDLSALMPGRGQARTNRCRTRLSPPSDATLPPLYVQW